MPAWRYAFLDSVRQKTKMLKKTPRTDYPGNGQALAAFQKLAVAITTEET